MKGVILAVAILALACTFAGVVVSPLLAVLGFAEGCIWIAMLCPVDKER
jgi:hypothetical protein